MRHEVNSGYAAAAIAVAKKGREIGSKIAWDQRVFEFGAFSLDPV